MAAAVSWRSSWFANRAKPGIPALIGAGLGCSRHAITGIKTISGENAMVLQPVHELIPRGRVRGGLRRYTRAVPPFFDNYPIADFTTACQLHAGLRSSDRGISLHPPIGFFALSSLLAMAAGCCQSHTGDLIDAAARRCSSSTHLHSSITKALLRSV